MSNRFNYRCPKCGSPDEIEICAFVSIRLTATGAEIAEEVQDIDGSCWSADNAAGCGACGYEGAVRNFDPNGAAIIRLFPTRISTGE
jgi:hypothetical protein